MVEYGDPDHRFGFLYDEQDGTGLDRRPALAIDRGGGRRPNLVLFKFSRRKGCREPRNRTDPARDPGNSGHRRPGQASAFALVCAPDEPRRAGEAAQRTSSEREARLERMSEQFDEWESCLSWIPVTEYGDPEQRYGYVYEAREASGAIGPRLRSTAASGTTRTTCSWAVSCRGVQLRHRGGDEETDSPPPPPELDLRGLQRRAGEAVDRPRRAESSDARLDRDTPAGATGSMTFSRSSTPSWRTSPTSGEPVEEFDTFDQCMHLIGVAQHGSRSGSFGYAYGKRGELRPALAMDMRGFKDAASTSSSPSPARSRRASSATRTRAVCLPTDDRRRAYVKRRQAPAELCCPTAAIVHPMSHRGHKCAIGPATTERRGWDSNPRTEASPVNSFQGCRIQPLCHPSGCRAKCDGIHSQIAIRSSMLGDGG